MATHYTGTGIAFFRAQALQTMPWYTITDLGSWIRDNATLTFKVASARQAALDALATLIADPPYNMSPTTATGAVRFGSTIVDVSPPLYVCAVWGPFNKIFQQIRQSLMYKEALTTMQPSSGGPMPGGRNTFAIDDAQQGFNNGITALMTELNSANNLFNQAAFEATFRLTWA